MHGNPLANIEPPSTSGYSENQQSSVAPLPPFLLDGMPCQPASPHGRLSRNSQLMHPSTLAQAAG